MLIGAFVVVIGIKIFRLWVSPNPGIGRRQRSFPSRSAAWLRSVGVKRGTQMLDRVG